MVDALIKKELQDALGVHTFVLQWKTPPTLDRINPDMSRSQRLDVLKEAIDSIKSRLLSSLQNRPGLKIKDLPGMSEAIITASNQDWLEVIPELEESDEAILLPNAQFHTMRQS